MKRSQFPSFREYYEYCAKEGRIYMFDGEISGGYTPVFYGISTTRLTQDDKGNWDIGQGMIFPDFEKEPQVLKKVDFENKMKNLGVSQELLQEFFSFKPDMTNF